MTAPAQKIQLHLGPPLIALVGNPNCGKTALFNRLTGSRQKVANYAGVTVERKEGRLQTPQARSLRVLDLPGTYGLIPRSPDEQVTTDVLHGTARGETQPDLVVCVLDATNLRRGLRLVLNIRELGLPIIVALNMTDLARKRGIDIDIARLSALLELPVVPMVAIDGEGMDALVTALDKAESWHHPLPLGLAVDMAEGAGIHPAVSDQMLAQQILDALGIESAYPHPATDRIDAIVLHPVAGPLILTIVLFLIFQAVFVGAEWPTAMIETGIGTIADTLNGMIAAGWLRTLLVDGMLAGVGGVLAFLPQILILYFFILILEESGYMPRAAFLLDRMMGHAGLSGRSFISLLSSFACAVPGIMATRSISNTRDRLITIMIAPLMTCSARLPVYALLIGAFIPARTVLGVMNLQGLVLFALYLIGIVMAFVIAWLLKHLTARRQTRTLMMELPTYHLPRIGSLALGLWQRAQIFIRRVGTIILILTLLLSLLSSFPLPPADATEPAIRYSFAGQIGEFIAPFFAPIGFNWQISIALIPGMAAREMMVGALSTVYALSSDLDGAQLLVPMIAKEWSLATGMALLAWFIFAPQCISTLAAARRETGGWGIPAAILVYLFSLAYLAAWLTYRISLYLFH